MQSVVRVPVIVIGGGQAGLATSHELSRREVSHLLLEAGPRVGESWRSRWDSLRLFTPAHYDGLPGMTFPSGTPFPSKDEMAAYLEAYASHFQLPVRLGVRVDGLTRTGSGFAVTAGSQRFEAGQVVVATGPFQSARVPAFASGIDAAVIQLHAGEYRRPSQLKDGPVLVVGAGNSGAELALEAVQAGHRTYLAGRSTGEIPAAAYLFGGRFFWFFANHVLSVKTPIGRRVRPHVIRHGGPLIRLRMEEVVRAGVERTPRAVGTLNGRPVLEDGRTLDVANIIWCTGFGRDFSWIDLPILDADGMPRHERGAALGVPGLYFVGLPFLTRLASAFIGGVGGDAGRIAEVVARRLDASNWREAAPTAAHPVSQ
jgi:putative flavoprotein involved in K+ transport